MSVQDEVRRVLPLTIDGVELVDPFFTVYGDGWNLNVSCDWALSRLGTTIATSDSDEVAIARSVDGLVGLQVVDVDLDEGLLDPVFRFSDGVVLSITADTDLDPWVFRAEGMSLTLVGRGPDGYREWLDQERRSQVVGGHVTEFLTQLRAWYDSARVQFEGTEYELEYSEPDMRGPKPSSWVGMSSADRLARLTVWASGEAELSLADVTTADIQEQHVDLSTRDDLGAALGLLLAWVSGA